MLSAAPVWGDARADLSDSAGDTVDGDTDAPLQVAQADILRSSILSTAEGIALNVQVRNPTAPLADKAWDGATEIEWSLDTTGDGEPDFVADYSTESRSIIGDVYRSSDNDDEPVLCKVKSTTFSVDAGYTAVMDPVCIGAPQTVAYAVEFSYDTNPDDDNAPVAEDDSPDTGVSPKVDLGQPADPPAAPSSGGSTGTPPPVPVQSSAPAPVRAPSGGISTAAPAPSAKTSPPGPAASATPASVSPTSGRDDAAPASGAASEPGMKNMAATGPAYGMLTAWGGAALAVGGLCVMFGVGHGARHRPGHPPGRLVALAERGLSW